MAYEVSKYKGRWAIYCSASETFIIYEGKNKKTKKELQEQVNRLNKIDVLILEKEVIL